MSHLHVLASKSSIHPPEVICMFHTDVIGMQHHTPTSLGRHVCVDCVTIVHTLVFETPANSYQTWCFEFIFEADARPPKNSLPAFI